MCLAGQQGTPNVSVLFTAALPQREVKNPTTTIKIKLWKLKQFNKTNIFWAFLGLDPQSGQIIHPKLDRMFWRWIRNQTKHNSVIIKGLPCQIKITELPSITTKSTNTPQESKITGSSSKRTQKIAKQSPRNRPTSEHIWIFPPKIPKKVIKTPSKSAAQPRCCHLSSRQARSSEEAAARLTVQEASPGRIGQGGPGFRIFGGPGEF